MAPLVAAPSAWALVWPRSGSDRLGHGAAMAPLLAPPSAWAHRAGSVRQLAGASRAGGAICLSKK
jgi:hypothetical protein